MIEIGCAKVNIIKHSVSGEGIELVTLHARYPRMIHSEIMTHRAFSRNGRSSRAVPTMTLVQEDPYYPKFKKNQPGMQAGDYLDEETQAKATAIWERMVRACNTGAKNLQRIGVHKQWANRPTEWYGYIDVLISSTDFNNFFTLRDHADAQPEINDVAEAIRKSISGSTPNHVESWEWHLPYITNEELEEYPIDILQKVSVARCARVSYKPFDGKADVESELARYTRLVAAKPVHASPTEHVATPDIRVVKVWAYPEQHGNFRGWRQLRHMIPGNTIEG